MSMSKLAKASIKKTIGLEKGYVNDSRDLGGATRYGITEAVAREYGYRGRMQDLPYSLAMEIYSNRYWNPLRLDEFSDQKLAYKVFDIAVNSGRSRAVKILQEAYNMCVEGNPLVVDGMIGKNTIGHVNRFNDPSRLRLIFEANKISRYIEITKAREKNETFIGGWLLKRSSLGDIKI